MYFGQSGFVLRTCQSNTLVYREEAKWTDIRSIERILDENNTLCTALEVNVTDPVDVIYKL
jgi:hypothetical protein